MNTPTLTRGRAATAALCALFILLLAAAPAAAQIGTATVRGTVTDQQGQAVAGATVTLRNAAKNFARTQTTSGEGSYTFTAVPPDTYTVEVEQAGFKKVTVSDVRALVDTPTDVDVALQIGAVTESVDVSASIEAPLNTTDASIGNTFESRRIEELPLNARNVVGLLSLQPGVTRGGEVTGSRRDQANITLDGTDVNEQQTGLDVLNPSGTVAPGQAFSSVIRVNPDSVQEFRVTTSAPNVTQGRSSGGQVSLVTKSGTNEFHGSAYWFHRNTVFTANDWFNNAAGRFTATDPQVTSGQRRVGDLRVPRPKLLRNIYGGSLGGPVIRDRLFFFYSYEGRRDAAEQSVLRNVPTATLRQGIVQYTNNAGGTTTLTPADIARIYPATGGVNPVALQILQTAPLPNDFTVGDGLNRAGFRFNAPIKNEFESHQARLDLTVTDRQTLFFRGNYQDDLIGGAPNFPGTPAPDTWNHPKAFTAGHTWTVTDTLVNNLRVGLTRVAFSAQGDNNGVATQFRDVFQPFLNTRTLSRTTPTWNVVDDVSWVKGNHVLQFGGNLRFIRNQRTSFANSFDVALVNFQFYEGGGASLYGVTDIASTINPSFNFDYGRAAAAVLGRFSQYSIRAVFDKSGQIQPAGTPSEREFATEEYDFYAQDSWKARPNLTVTYGLRYGVNTPVYETQGFQLVPTENLGEFFRRRVEGAAAGAPVNDPLTFNLGGKANNAPGFYEMDKNNFAPLVSFAWSPNFGDGAGSFFGRLLGRDGRSVIRGGYRLVYDRFGSQLAVDSESENSFGFSSEVTNGANSTNATTNLGPLVTLNPDVRSFPRISAPNALTFPLVLPSDETDRILAGIDQSLTTPYQHQWNVSYGRELPRGFAFELSYVGRAGRNLLLVRDIMQPNNIVDPTSGQDWYSAFAQLNALRNANAPILSVQPIPFFQNLFPALALTRNIPGVGPTLLTPTQFVYRLHARTSVGGLNDFDPTNIQFTLDDASRLGRNIFFHPQYAALQTLSSVGRANYNAFTVSLRQRFRSDFLMDFNYTLAKALDDGSPLETNRVLSNVLRQSLDTDAQYSHSAFDVRHNINANWLAALPVGRGRRFLDTDNSVVNSIIGGWQLSGIVRFNTGVPYNASDSRWATNWQSQSFGTRLANVCSDGPADVNGQPNAFRNPLAVYNSFRNSRAGEAGDRNIGCFRQPSYFTLDAALAKNFNMWYAEGHTLQFRWEVFNVTNTQPFGTISSLTLDQDPFLATTVSPNFGRFTASQTPVGETRPGRLMQFALRYRF
jgi:hypothetical protein